MVVRFSNIRTEEKPFVFPFVSVQTIWRPLLMLRMFKDLWVLLKLKWVKRRNSKFHMSSRYFVEFLKFLKEKNFDEDLMNIVKFT